MRHDELCELERNRGHGCNCGSRACPLCDACQDGKHLHHVSVNPDGKACMCDLCAAEVSA